MRTLGLFALLGLCGCLDTNWRGVDLALTFEGGCGTPGGLDGVKRLRLETAGAGFQPDPVELDVPSGGGTFVYRLAAGSARRLVVTGLDASGQVVSVGRTALEDVPLFSTAARPVTVTLLPVNAWVGPKPGGGCLTLAAPRLAQSTLLDADGRVLVSGGHTDEGGAWAAVSTTEWIPQGTGPTSPGQPLVFHAPTGDLALGADDQPGLRLPSGFLLFSGGLRVTAGVAASSAVNVVCSEPDALCGVLPDQHLLARSGHHLLGVGADVWSVGGVHVEAGQRTPVADIDVLDTTANTFRVLGLDGTDATPARARDGSLWLVGGGRADRVDASGAVLEHLALRTVRRSPTVVPLSDGGLLALGGVDASGAAVAGSELIHPGGTELGPLLPAVSGACATTLEDGSVLVAGGASASGSALLEVSRVFSDGHLEALPHLPAPRTGAGCHTRPDGSVVLAGGAEQDGSPAPQVLVLMPD